jgi:two-component system, NtrC family, nitrogen regulation sensor histidine kinase GlnL
MHQNSAMKANNDSELGNLDLLSVMTTSVLVVNSELNVVNLNASAQTLIALSESKLKGRSLLEVFPHTVALGDAVKRALNEERSFMERGIYLGTRSSEKMFVDCSVMPLWVGEESPTVVLIEMTNVARHRSIQRDGQMAIQNTASSALIQGLAHEIKNPLGGIRGAAQLLERELSNKALAEYTQVIIGEADRLRLLVDRMLEPAGQLDMKELNIHEILEHVRLIVDSEHGTRVSILDDYDPSLPLVRADKDKLIQALLNIVRNAAQAVFLSKGKVILRTRVQRKFTIGSKLHRLVMVIRIIDSGPGIDPELGTSIFYPLVSGRPEGTGLGLPIAQSLIQKQGGLIGFESEEGKTVFSVWLPLGGSE